MCELHVKVYNNDHVRPEGEGEEAKNAAFMFQFIFVNHHGVLVNIQKYINIHVYTYAIFYVHKLHKIAMDTIFCRQFR